MTDDLHKPAEHHSALARIRQEIEASSSSARRRAIEKFTLAALASIPWIGSLLAAAGEFRLEERSARQDDLQTQWLEEHNRRMGELGQTLGDVIARFDALGEEINQRIESPEYLALVRRAFRAWDNAETEEKRRLVANLVSNAAGTRICSDDVVRLFVDWLSLYHETHFAVIREIYREPGATRYDIWISLYGSLVREDSAEADLFRLLIRDLSTGGVIRQARETTHDGQFLKRRSPAQRTKSAASSTMESAFEDTKPYVLTELGSQFVHYTMNEVVGRLGAT